MICAMRSCPAIARSSVLFLFCLPLLWVKEDGKHVVQTDFGNIVMI